MLEGKGPIISGRNTRFTCKSRGSRPAAKIKWFLGYHEITPSMIRSNPFVVVDKDEDDHSFVSDEQNDGRHTDGNDLMNHISKFVNKHMKKQHKSTPSNHTFDYEEFGSNYILSNSSRSTALRFRKNKTTISILSMIPDAGDHGKHITCRTYNPVLVNSYESSALEETIRLDVNCK